MTSLLAAFVETAPKDTPQATAEHLFEHARRDWLLARPVNGEGDDFRFNSYISRRRGLTEQAERALGTEAVAYFRQRREEADRSVAKAREEHAAREMAHRNAQGEAATRAEWVERNLSAFLRVAGELRAIANEIESARGEKPVSVFMPSTPPIADDAAIVGLTSQLADQLNAALAVITLTGRDAQARIRLEKAK